MSSKKGFSFTRLVGNMFPNFAKDSASDVDLSPTQAEALFTYQLSLPTPRHLSPLSFFVAEITTSKTVSEKVWRGLVKAGIVLSAPGGKGRGGVGGVNGGGDGMTVNTSKIGKGFASQLAVISVHAQRKVVGLLFFWEEECVRWRLLEGEKREIEVLMGGDGGGGDGDGSGNEDLEIALRAVEMKMKLKPSERAGGAMNVGVGRGEVLPAYK